ncbi:hypothetical protein TcYC6_0026980 [Trypanosoma cruzi]|nr:hypothetical protein TcYC6_0026980 [Trypanosoma cruzi]
MHRPPSSRMHRSMDVEPFSFRPGDVKIVGGKWERKESLSYYAGRGTRGTLSLIALFAILPYTMDVWVDNTSLQERRIKASRNRTP